MSLTSTCLHPVYTFRICDGWLTRLKYGACGFQHVGGSLLRPTCDPVIAVMDTHSLQFNRLSSFVAASHKFKARVNPRIHQSIGELWHNGLLVRSRTLVLEVCRIRHILRSTGICVGRDRQAKPVTQFLITSNEAILISCGKVVLAVVFNAFRKSSPSVSKPPSRVGKDISAPYNVVITGGSKGGNKGLPYGLLYTHRTLCTACRPVLQGIVAVMSPVLFP